MPSDFSSNSLFSNACNSRALSWTVDEWPHLEAAHIKIPNELKNASVKRRREFAAGRYCASIALQQAGCKNLDEIKIGVNRAPIWPEGFIGSISHSQGYSIAAVASNSLLVGLGVDAERILPEKTAVRIRNKILTANEMSLLSSYENLSRGVSVIFSAKESLFKALNPIVHKKFGFQDAEVFRISSLNSQLGEIRFRLLSTLSKAYTRDFEITAQFQIRDRVMTAVEIPKNIP